MKRTKGKQEHPRIRGENRCLSLGFCRIGGTSPHTRGKQSSWPSIMGLMRNIPAYAGKTMPMIFIFPFFSEHPRIRGENRIKGFFEPFGGGTSPHTRGKPFGESLPFRLHRNIPAYAGKTSGFWSIIRCFPEHPRIRGENCDDTSAQATTTRNIPAYAGKTWSRKFRSPVNKEHPRIRGENVVEAFEEVFNFGTSPHTRGKREWGGSLDFSFRNIPAYAGKTGCSAAGPCRWQEHPRVCGENATGDRTHIHA